MNQALRGFALRDASSDRIWASNPPDSFHMFLGQYGQKTAHYWRVVSALAIVTFVLSFIVNWHLVDRMFWLFVALALYVAIQLATMAYFVAEQEALISNAGSLSRGYCTLARIDGYF